MCCKLNNLTNNRQLLVPEQEQKSGLESEDHEEQSGEQQKQEEVEGCQEEVHAQHP